MCLPSWNASGISRKLKKRCCPWFNRLAMRMNALKTLDFILSLSKNEATISCCFSNPLVTDKKQYTPHDLVC
jgi:hypothetical protein